MGNDHSPAVFFHMGMHKTGSTSYQAALNRARDDLKARGVFYPNSVEGAIFKEQHADIARFVLSMRSKDLKEYFLSVKKEAAENNYPMIIFSSEDFSHIGFNQNLLDMFSEVVDEVFPRSTYILVVRNVVDHLSSSLSQRIVGNSLNVNVSNFGEQAAAMLMSRAASIVNFKNHLGSRLVFLDYSSLIVDGNLCSRLHGHIDIDSVDLIHEVRLNVASENDILNLLTSCFRGILSLSINEGIYSRGVMQELTRFVDLEVLRSALVPGAVAEFKSMYSAALNKVASEVVAKSMPRLLEILSGLDESVLEYYVPEALRNS